MQFAIYNSPSEANGNFSSFASRNIALIYGYDCLRWTSFFSPDFTENLEQNYLHYQNLTDLSLFLFSDGWYFKKKRFRILPCFQGFALQRSKSVLTRRIENVNESVYWFLSPKSRFDFADRWSWGQGRLFTAASRGQGGEAPHLHHTWGTVSKPESQISSSNFSITKNMRKSCFSATAIFGKQGFATVFSWAKKCQV